jgi:DNA-directed RNA polymerase specialized sigma24 family protein
MTAHDGGDADVALVRQFRQAQTRRESAAVFADVVRQHRGAVLAFCAERLWPDGDAAVAAAGDVFIAASLAMADSAKLARPELLRVWLLGIAAHGGLASSQPARIDDINWEMLQAQVATDVPELRDSSGTRAWVRHWLDQIVATLPEPRQRLYDLVVTRDLDSRSAALELGTNVAEVRRLRYENRQAILRAFEVTALAAETAPDPGSEAPGCWELRQILADAPHDGDPREGGRRSSAVLPAALRLAVARHLSQCVTCQEQRDDCMAWWEPELLPILAGSELSEQVMEDLRLMPEFARPRPAPGAHRRVASVGTIGKVVIRRAAATGGGLLAAMLLLAFVWPGFLHGSEASVHRGSTAPSPHDPSGSHVSTPQVTGKIGGVPSRNSRRQVSPGAAGLLSKLPQAATGSSTVPSSPASQTSPVQSTVQPSTAPTPAPTQHTSAAAPTSSPSAQSPSPSASQPTPSPSTSAPTTTAPTTTAPTTTAPTTTAPTTTAPTTTAPTTPAPTTSAPATPAPSASESASSTAPSSAPAPVTSASS